MRRVVIWTIFMLLVPSSSISLVGQEPKPSAKPADSKNEPAAKPKNSPPAPTDAKPGSPQPSSPAQPKKKTKLDLSPEATVTRIQAKLPQLVNSELSQLKEERDRLINNILIPGGVKDPRAIEAIRHTPRHTFVPDALRDEAYLDRALPIGEAQTISSPYIVAVMTEAIEPHPDDKVLEIGTGSGYQAAVLSPLVKDVYTIEIVEPIGRETTEFLKKLGYDNIHTKIGDGYQGWQEFAPFQKIIVTCSPEKVPQPLMDQLEENGLMIIPVGKPHQQVLHLFRKQDGKLVSLSTRPTLFVPMTGTAEEKREGKEGRGVELINGDFEAKVTTPGYIPGWYYEFNAKLTEDPKSPFGKNCVEFSSQKGELPSLLIQGLKLDGRETPVVVFKGAAIVEDVKAGKTATEVPVINLQLLDENREPIGSYWLGPFVGTSKWKVEEQTIRIPIKCREAILQVGLFGATGTIRFDGISLKPKKR